MTTHAYYWGVAHGSCDEALEERKKHNTQADWYKACDRGDWLIWQLNKIDPKLYMNDLIKIVDTVANRGTGDLRLKERAERAHKNVELAKTHIYAECFLKDAMKAIETVLITVKKMTWAFNHSVADVMEELRTQADDIRSVIPEWPEKEAEK